MSRIREEYIETGKVRFVYKHFAILGPDSVRSAEASECAAEQDIFWEYHDALFQALDQNRADLSFEGLVDQAVELGADRESFVECLESGRYNDQIQQESRMVQSLGIRGTPAFLLNGVFLSGAQPFEIFQDAIEKQLDVDN